MKKNITLFLLLALSQIAQAQNFVWGHSLGGQSADRPCSIQTDQTGNVYVCTQFSDSIDVDPGPNRVMTYSLPLNTLVVKYDSFGNYIWHINFDYDAGGSKPYCMRFVDDAHFVVLGTYSNKIDLDPGPDSTIYYGPGTYFAEFDTSGNYIWGKALSAVDVGSFQMNCFFRTDDDGNIYITGKANTLSDVDPGPDTVALNGNGVFFGKYDSSGNFIFAKILGGTTFNSHGIDIAVDQANNIYVTGIFNSTIDLDPGPNTASFTAAGFNNYDDIFFAKYDSLGNYIRGFQIGGIALDGGTAIQFDDSDNVYLAGCFTGTADFDPSPTSHSLGSALSDIFIAKYDSSFQYKWVKQIGGSQEQRLTAFTKDLNGNLYLAGYYEGLSDFDPGTGTSATGPVLGYYEMFAAIYDPSGNYLYSMGVGSPETDHAYDIETDNLGGFYLIGDFVDSMDCDPGIGTSMIYSNSSGIYDVYFAKYSPLILSTSDFKTYSEMKLFPSPTSGNLNFENSIVAGNSSISIFNSLGREVYTRKFKMEVSSIDVSILPSGTYFVRIINGEQSRVGKFVKID